MERIWIAGPCAAESRTQLLATAEQLAEQTREKGLSLQYFRAGAWKVRSAPDSFAGAGEAALPWLQEVQNTYHIPVCVEVMNAKHVDLCAEHGIHTVWVGARTSVNPVEVQKIADAVKHSGFTVMVKNPMIPDLKLWIGNIERFLKADIRGVMAIHRGFPDVQENIYRNAPFWHIPIELKVQMPDLPILCDPSHLCGKVEWIPEVAQLAMNYGFNGLMVECHPHPEQALSDADQQMLPTNWADMISHLDLRNDSADLELVKQRSTLENIDNQISTLLYQRMKMVDEIAEIKRKNHISVVQPQQWQQVVKRYMKHSEDPYYQVFIKQFLELLHQSSIERQK
ncbi:MAG: bifunctional 3-deoxy-7-phosphoheptulonate synthase/chorismate mutase type II [Bacteroidales bacterium]|nr:bifunctional 3-deoxy-7-phosphoheptulonate synthase/chorismate mutase type II [Bacteroidales bacterium]